MWWTLGHRARSAKARHSVGCDRGSRRKSTPARPRRAGCNCAAWPSQKRLQKTRAIASPMTPEEAGVLPRVTGIRHWSSAESSTVVIDIQDQVQYEAHRLPQPERIYFDLHDTTLGAGLSNRTITVNDALLQRVRVAQPMAGVTRVVLETNGASDFSVSLEPNPYRLVDRSSQAWNQAARPNEGRSFRSREFRSLGAEWQRSKVRPTCLRRIRSRGIRSRSARFRSTRFRSTAARPSTRRSFALCSMPATAVGIWERSDARDCWKKISCSILCNASVSWSRAAWVRKLFTPERRQLSRTRKAR